MTNYLRKKTILFHVLVIVLLPAASFFAQPFCLTNCEFNMPAIAIRAQLEGSFWVTFNIRELQPQDIKVMPVDSADKMVFGLFENATIDNIKKITYLWDTSNVKLTVRYLLVSGRELNNNYARLVSDSEIHFVFKLYPMDMFERYYPPDMFHRHSHDKKKCKSDTLTLFDTFEFKSGSVKASNILVERIFSHNKDSTIILENNYPEHSSDILEVASQYSKENFLDHCPKAKKYFIRIFVEHWIKECSHKRIY